MANPGGFEPLADGLKGRCLSIRLYARGPCSELPFADDDAGLRAPVHPLALRLDQLEARCAMRAMLLHVGLSWLVVPAGSAPAFHGYRPRALLLDEGTVMLRVALPLS